MSLPFIRATFSLSKKENISEFVQALSPRRIFWSLRENIRNVYFERKHENFN